MAPTLGYWDVRGLGEPIRCLLHYTGTAFEDKRYKMGPAPDYSREQWLKVKPTMTDLDFPNLPYFIDGDVKMTQTFAIIRHIALQHGLMPKLAPGKLWKAEMIELEAIDLLVGFQRLCYGEGFEKEREGYVKSLPDKLAAFTKFLGSNQWLVGDQLTHVDFIFHEALDLHRYLAPDLLGKFPKMKEYLERFEALPNVAKYLKSSEFKRWPINGAVAKFGGSGKPPI